MATRRACFATPVVKGWTRKDGYRTGVVGGLVKANRYVWGTYAFFVLACTSKVSQASVLEAEPWRSRRTRSDEGPRGSLRKFDPYKSGGLVVSLHWCWGSWWCPYWDDFSHLWETGRVSQICFSPDERRKANMPILQTNKHINGFTKSKTSLSNWIACYNWQDLKMEREQLMSFMLASCSKAGLLSGDTGCPEALAPWGEDGGVGLIQSGEEMALGHLTGPLFLQGVNEELQPGSSW